ncbi:hypothetical protein BOX37_23375 [Nocardia mangyaensis]|uniref:DUF1707 domain-containing protein n=1 Tax=Nocardia mangyaensis TaxID=2213200 RepID=A0A1J0VWE0_9NOCA|nr:DUF1707 domain-containing protein [Nocardia mangyaensis]APE36384.1 hypothetical protein BOX37_23375 [Nocardia mangyaensis]
MAESLPDDDLRVGNPERERAIALLNDAFAAGYLEISEFEERSLVAYSARTRGELRGVLAQLPVAGQLFPDAVARPGAMVPAPVGVAPMEIEADWTTVRRKGLWQVPARLLIIGSWGTIDLNFVKAEFLGPSVDIELQVSVSTVKLMLGADHTIDYGDVESIGWSSVKDKAGPPKRPGGQVIRLYGAISGMSGVVIRRR